MEIFPPVTELVTKRFTVNDKDVNITDYFIEKNLGITDLADLNVLAVDETTDLGKDKVKRVS